jgi:hypothetical protein
MAIDLIAQGRFSEPPLNVFETFRVTWRRILRTTSGERPEVSSQS